MIGYELPAGMLHGHAVATCMGYGAYLAKQENFISEEECRRIMTLISNMELALWHDIMDNHDLFESCNAKITAKRGGNLCAPLPKPLGRCGYLNDLPRDRVDSSLNEYKQMCKEFPRLGHGIDVHCREVGLEDPSVTAQDAFKDISKTEDPATSYNDWIKTVQTQRNKDWKFNVQFTASDDTIAPPDYDKFTLFHPEVETYAMNNTSLASKNLQRVAKLTEDQDMFMPCMVGTLESQFLKMMCQVKNAKRCLDIGTFTGMSALAMAEGVGENGHIVTLECDEKIAKVAQQGFDSSNVGNRIKMLVGNAAQARAYILIKYFNFLIVNDYRR